MNRMTLLLLAVAACGDDTSTPVPPVQRAVIVAGDFDATGVISQLDIESLAMQPDVVQGVAEGDPVLRHHGDELYVINRIGANNVTILDAKTLQLVDQLGTGANSNPQDVAVVGDKLYVPALGTSGVVVVSRGSTATKTIDLSALETMGQTDGKPDCMSAYAVGTKVYVACGLLDGFMAVQPGAVAVIDSATDTLITSVALTYANPWSFFERAPESSVYAGDLLIATVPVFTDYATGCVERVSTGATPTVSCGVTNQQLGGFANRLAVAPDDGLLYVPVGTYDAEFNETGRLEGLDLETGALWTEPVSAPDQMITDVAVCPNGDVVATDKTKDASGLRVWRGGTERTGSALPIGMTPSSITALTCYDAADRD